MADDLSDIEAKIFSDRQQAGFEAGLKAGTLDGQDEGYRLGFAEGMRSASASGYYHGYAKALILIQEQEMIDSSKTSPSSANVDSATISSSMHDIEDDINMNSFQTCASNSSPSNISKRTAKVQSILHEIVELTSVKEDKVELQQLEAKVKLLQSLSNVKQDFSVFNYLDLSLQTSHDDQQ